MRRISVRRLDEPLLPIKFGSHALNMILAYVTDESGDVSRGNLGNVKKLFRMIDPNIYDRDAGLAARFKYIKKAVDIKLVDEVSNKKLILESCRCNRWADINDDIMDDIKSIKLKKGDLKQLTKMISEKLSYSYIYRYKGDIVNMIAELEAGDYDSLKEFNQKFKKVIKKLMDGIRTSEREEDENVFSLKDAIFKKIVKKTVQKLASPTNKLRVGMQKLNEILSGGFEDERFYTFLGPSGGGKSVLLLNLLKQLKDNNKGYQVKYEGNIPTILMITQENSVTETIDRLYSLAVGSGIGDELKDQDPEEVIERLKSEGSLSLTLDDNVDIMVVYKAPRSITTADIYDIIDDIEEDGREVIALIHDYMNRLKASEYAADLRIELGYIVDELKTLAIVKSIPVITATQLNRDAIKIMEAASEAGTKDIAKHLNASNTGESWGIIMNADFACIISPETDTETGKHYMSFKRVKLRFKPISRLEYFHQPFDGENTMRLVQDEGKECQAIYSFNKLEDVMITDIINGQDRKRVKSQQALEAEEFSKIFGNPPVKAA